MAPEMATKLPVRLFLIKRLIADTYSSQWNSYVIGTVFIVSSVYPSRLSGPESVALKKAHF